jgi:hypothetical protein
MFESLQRHRLPRFDGAFFGFADFHGAHAILRGDDRGRLAARDGFNHVIKFAKIPILTAQGEHARIINKTPSEWKSQIF